MYYEQTAPNTPSPNFILEHQNTTHSLFTTPQPPPGRLVTKEFGDERFFFFNFAYRDFGIPSIKKMRCVYLRGKIKWLKSLLYLLDHGLCV